MIAALQHGDTASLERAIEQRSKVLDKAKNRELSWHHERLLLVLRMNRGQFSGVGAELERLRDIAKRLGLHAWPTLWGSDLAELLLRTGDSSLLASAMRPALTPAEHDLPSVPARKLRFLVELGFEADARAAMAQVTSEYILDLPHDRDYIGVLCQLAATSAALGERAQYHARSLNGKRSRAPTSRALGQTLAPSGGLGLVQSPAAAWCSRPHRADQLSGCARNTSTSARTPDGTVRSL